jgi:hypothetical protein
MSKHSPKKALRRRQKNEHRRLARKFQTKSELDFYLRMSKGSIGRTHPSLPKIHIPDVN